jgi:hypothetical protein
MKNHYARLDRLESRSEGPYRPRWWDLLYDCRNAALVEQMPAEDQVIAREILDLAARHKETRWGTSRDLVAEALTSLPKPEPQPDVTVTEADVTNTPEGD